MNDRNFFDGTADSVFQGRDVYGGVHFHPPAGPAVPPVQVLEPPRHYRNNEAQLDELTHIHDEAAGRVGIAILIGAPGSGRTTLGECWAFRNRDRFPDGVFPVRLGNRPVTDVLADQLGLVGYHADQLPASLEARSAMWRAWSATKRIALLIDDAMSVAEVRALLPAGPGSMVAVVEAARLTELTTRHSARYVELEPLSDDAAEGVLTALVGAERLAAEPVQLVALLRICAGSAAELTVAGAMLSESTWSVEELIGRIRRKGGLAKPVFDVAYDRLRPDTQAVYRVFGAHPGDGDVAEETVAAVLELDCYDAQDALDDLVRAKLIHRAGADRYRMAELTRLHARSKGDTLTSAVVSHYASVGLAIAESALPRGWAAQLWPGFAADGRTSRVALDWLEAERLNLVAAAESAYRLGALEDACRLALVLWPVHKDGGHTAEMNVVNQNGVAAARAWSSVLAEALMYTQLGFAAIQSRDWQGAREHLGRAASLAEKSGSVEAQATAVESLALACFEAGEQREAEEHFRRNLDLAEGLGNARRSALARMHLAKVAPYREAVELLAAAGEVLAGEPGNRVKIVLWRGRNAIEAGAFDEGIALLADAIQLAADGGFHRERILAARTRAEAALSRGDVAVARAHAEDALNVARLRGYTAEAGDLLEWLGRLG
ncbi:hypothetical protein [Amycolatopsis sp. NPDC051903]|uniref:hypothetical protein n=1 Tax=Amycolatopsis sp. NPDC051903 TaxID=3363936 RepID=UPI00379748C5